jgi:tripartite-type tricarboxylate transporter receptor subunit TctC
MTELSVGPSRSGKRQGSFHALVLSIAMALLAPGSMALADEVSTYPDKAIRIIVPYTAGGFNDTLARLVAAKLQQSWKQPVIVDNKPGGGTIIATQAVASAPADGYTILVAAFPFATNPLVYRKLPYDKDAFAPIVLAGRSPLVLAVPAGSPFQSVADIVEAAKAKPGSLNYGSAGIASSNHLLTELFSNEVGIRMNHVPYKGGAPLMADLAGNQVDLAFDLVPNALPFIQGNKLRAIAVSDEKRSPALPQTPTVAEALKSAFDVVTWHGFVAPRATPSAIVDRLNSEINEILKLPETRAEFERQGVTPVGGSPQGFATFLAAQSSLWKGVIEKNGIKLE